MTPAELILARRVHLARLANESGAAGERLVLGNLSEWVPRPRGSAVKLLLSLLLETGISVKPSSFDAVAVPYPGDFTDAECIRGALGKLVFIEVKTANQPRVKPGFDGFFFALTENEISAASQLGDRHAVALYNNITGELLMTNVQSLLARARSSTWQVSIQL